MIATTSTPRFEVQSSVATIILGNSERREVGGLLARTLDERRIFEDINLVTLNEAAAFIGRASLRELCGRSTVFTHSAGVTRILHALQIVAINPPEPVDGMMELMKRAVQVGGDQIVPETGAHETGMRDLALAGLEQIRSPFSTLSTMYRIGRGGYSTVEALSLEGKTRFPAGRAIVHAESDGFGFSNEPKFEDAEAAGITTLMMDKTFHHNTLLFAPGRVLDAMTPTILPAQ